MGAFPAVLTATLASAVGYTFSIFSISNPSSTTFATTLAPHLSSQAQICHPNSSCYRNATSRWQISWGIPHFDIVIHPSTIEDIQSTIRVANAHSKPFLAISGGHGATLSLANLRNGVGIWLESFKDVEILRDGQSAVVGGGVLSGELRDKLALHSKQTVQGACDCTGAVAPMLGGGHGWLQGRYGLMADNLISAKLVLGNGSLAEVSAHQHEDLFWALRGAGHNFGIVAEFVYKIYDVTEENRDWAYEQFYFEEEKLEEVLRVMNGMIGGVENPGPVELIVFGFAGRFPGVADGKVWCNKCMLSVPFVLIQLQVILAIFLIWQGNDIPGTYSSGFRALQPFNSVSGATDLAGVSVMMGFDVDAPPCAKNFPTLQRFPLALETYPLAGMRAAVDLLKSLPTEFNITRIILEAYSVNAVQSVPENSTAFADRSSNLLISPFITHAPNDANLARRGAVYGNEMRRVIVEGSGHALNAYVNYAHGTETQRELYGYQQWRVDRLQKLKRKWDPSNRFGWYLPIDLGSGGSHYDKHDM
ncbi:6-hydroxy-D-nicotine oxidase [Cercospora beticola]|uniref:6-hydroxy-D-nicotine oxidase n=1 Tax=Cercospora beticola TaxID=122368 RepID=A0A2G5H9W3_CERBT|nr:6-hydroxy-D-nicotine oxidase [Cercospora beticola]PIA89336.1 6-hydroxy-D-nicotine oxidase [Cercospora beticola]WPB03109.1 hypothetical protein RHO25_007746 [Cercospora beticola]